MTDSSKPSVLSIEQLFEPFKLGSATFPNRVAMAPMTRSFSPGGVPNDFVAAYYRRRAEGGTGLILTEGTYVNHPGTLSDPSVPRFYGDEALAGWANVVDAVHRAGALIMPQLWHIGLVYTPREALDPSSGFVFKPELGQVGPSGIIAADTQVTEPMTVADIAAVVEAFAQAAADAERIGFDGVEIHAAHGYLVDQFFWETTNQRADSYGGSHAARGRFAGEIVAAIRQRVAREFPIILRISQWKQQDYSARIAETPEELATLLAPAIDAGVDMVHCSQRRFWEGAFPGSSLSLAGWVRKLTGKPTMTVGSVGLDREFLDSLQNGGKTDKVEISELLTRLAAHEFDMVAIGRALIGDPAWPAKMRRGEAAAIEEFETEMLSRLV
jgi:2,4-dienoyl-CoA reductase-like NADH-dependent reductase (Old Yellow Enzyme family)